MSSKEVNDLKLDFVGTDMRKRSFCQKEKAQNGKNVAYTSCVCEITSQEIARSAHKDCELRREAGRNAAAALSERKALIISPPQSCG